MRTPSAKALMAHYGIDRKQVGLIKRLGTAASDGEKLSKIIEDECAATWAYARSCHGNPFDSQMWRRTMVLHAIDAIVGTSGVEGLGEGRGPSYAPPYEYLNAGDPYVRTLIYKRATDNLYFGSWGDIAERMPERGN